MPVDAQTTSILAWVMANAMIILLVCANLIGLAALYVGIRSSLRTARISRRIDRLGRQLDDQHVHMSKTRDLMRKLESSTLMSALQGSIPSAGDAALSDVDPEDTGFAPLDEADSGIEELESLDVEDADPETPDAPEPQSELRSEPLSELRPEPELAPAPAQPAPPEAAETPEPITAPEETPPPPPKSLFRDAVASPASPSPDAPAQSASPKVGADDADPAPARPRNNSGDGLVFRDIFGAPTPKKTLPAAPSPAKADTKADAQPDPETSPPQAAPPSKPPAAAAEADDAAQDDTSTVIPMPSSDTGDDTHDESDDEFSIPEFLKPRASSTQAPETTPEQRYPDPSDTPAQQTAASPAADEDDDDFHIPDFLKTGHQASPPEFGSQPPPPPAPSARSAQQAASQVTAQEEPETQKTENAPSTKTSDSTASPVDCSFYSPIDVEKDKAFIVQAIFHNAQSSAEADIIAKDIDPDTTHRVSKALNENIAAGQKVMVSLEIDGADIEDPIQTITWRNRVEPLQFSATFPKSVDPGGALAKARITVDGLPLGSAIWRITVKPAQILSPPATLQPEMAPPNQSIEVKRYTRAFISYSYKDRIEVLKRVQALRAAGLEVFQDLLDLEPGERWEKALYSHINECDVFFLFWSPDASKSEWVAKEWRYALDVSQLNAEHRPDICPVILTTPPPLPPAELSDRHFNDMIAYVLAAEEDIRNPEGQ